MLILFVVETWKYLAAYCNNVRNVDIWLEDLV